MARYLRGSVVIAARVTAVVLAIVLVSSAATGWLYWVRAWRRPLAGSAGNRRAAAGRAAGPR